MTTSWSLWNESLAQALIPINNRFDRIETLLDATNTKLDATNTKLDATITKLDAVAATVDILFAKNHNNLCDMNEDLLPVPLPDGSPLPLTCPFPTSIASLLVAGNEMLTNGAQNNWSREKSLILIRSYDPAYETDDGSDNEGRSSSKRRFKVAKCLGICLGISNAQMHFASGQMMG